MSSPDEAYIVASHKALTFVKQHWTLALPAATVMLALVGYLVADLTFGRMGVSPHELGWTPEAFLIDTGGFVGFAVLAGVTTSSVHARWVYGRDATTGTVFGLGCALATTVFVVAGFFVAVLRPLSVGVGFTGFIVHDYRRFVRALVYFPGIIAIAAAARGLTEPAKIVEDLRLGKPVNYSPFAITPHRIGAYQAPDGKCYMKLGVADGIVVLLHPTEVAPPEGYPESPERKLFLAKNTYVRLVPADTLELKQVPRCRPRRIKQQPNK